jgi:transcriptional regulator of acetoin/glycerol metabolism
MEAPCAFDGCSHPAAEGPWCWGHAKQQRLGKPLAELRDDSRTPKQVFLDAVLVWADVDAEDDEEFKRASDRLEKAALTWARWVLRGRKVSLGQVKRAVREANGNRTRAAQSLGVHRVTVWRVLQGM